MHSIGLEYENISERKAKAIVKGILIYSDNKYSYLSKMNSNVITIKDFRVKQINKYLVDFLQSPPAEQISAGVSEYPKMALAIPAQYLSTPSAQAWGSASTSQTKVFRMTISFSISAGVVRYVPNLATPALQVSQSIWFKRNIFII